MHTLYLKNPLSALSLCTFFSLLGFVFQPLMIFAGAGIALYCLLGNYRLAATLLLSSFLTIWLVFAQLFTQPNEPSLQYDSYWVFLVFHLPLVLSALTLGKTNNQALACLVNAIIVMIVISFTPLENVERDFIRDLEAVLSSLSQQNADIKPSNIDVLVASLVPIISASLFILLTASLFVARLWQSRAFNPGGFGKEFRAFCLGKTTALILSTIIILGIVNIEIAKEQIILAFLLLVLQGLSLVHFFAQKKHLGRNQLLVFYLLLCVILPLFFNQLFIIALFLLSLSACIDNWVNIRALSKDNLF